nr:C40 family peptidase [Nesterenkonia alkaliphila]
MRHQSLAIAELEEASELREEAERAQLEAEAALALDASDDYQNSETSAADVLLGEGDALADDATNQQLDEQAEQDAAEALQRQREAEERAAAQDEVAAASLGDLGAEEAQILQQRREADQRTCELLETLQEEEGFEGSLDDFLLWLYNREDVSETGTGYFGEDGSIDCDAVTTRISQLRTPAETQQTTASASNQTTEDSSDEAEGEAESSEESEVTSFDSLSAERRELLAQGAELEGFDGGTADYYRLVLDSAELTSGGAVDWDAFAAHVTYLDSRAEEPAPSPSASPSPSETATSSPSPSPSATPTQSGAASYGSLSSDQKALLAEAAELDSDFAGGAQDYYQVILNNDLFTTSSGSVSWTVVEGEVARLENQAAQAAASASPTPSPSPTASSSPSPTATPSPTRTPTPTPSSSPTRTATPSPTPTQNRVPHWDDLSGELQRLLSEGSNIDPRFGGGSGGDYWRWIPANRPDLLNSDGTVSTSKLATHLSGLRSSSSGGSSSGSSGGSSSSGSSSSGGSSSGSSSSGSSSSGSSSSGSSSSGSSSSGSSSSGGSQPAGNTGGSGAAQIAVNWARAEANRSGNYYQLGGNGPNAWDCSSFVQAAYASAGVSLGRTTYAQITQGTQVSWANRQPGDLIFWGNYHVAIYLGGGMIADAGSPSSGVSVRPVFQQHNISQVRRVG